MTKTNSLEQVIANGAAAYYMWLAEMTCDEDCAKCAFNDGDICYAECNDTYEQHVAAINELEILKLENKITASCTELLRLANQSRERELDLLNIEWDLIMLRTEYNL